MNLTPREQQEIEAALALAATPVEPPASLKADILGKLAATPQLPALSETEPGAGSNPQPGSAPFSTAATSTAATSTAAISTAERRAAQRWFTRPVTVLTSAAAALLLFVGGVFLGSALAPQPGADDRLAVLTAAPDLQRATESLADGATATLIWSLEQRRSALFVEGLPALPQGKTYQLWYMDAAGAATPAGTFEASRATTWRILDGRMTGGDTVGVTVEPAGGSPAPTSDPIVTFASS